MELRPPPTWDSRRVMDHGGKAYLLSTGDGKCMVCPVLDTKGWPREFLPTVFLLISSGFKFTLPMWSRKPQDERGLQSSLWPVLSCIYTTGVPKGSPRSLLPKLEARSSVLHLGKDFASRDLNLHSTGQNRFSGTSPLPAARRLVG